jgi:hypothetical protein
MLRLFSSRVKRQMLRNIKEDSGYKMARSHLCVCVCGNNFQIRSRVGGRSPPPKKSKRLMARGFWNQRELNPADCDSLHGGGGNEE